MLRAIDYDNRLHCGYEQGRGLSEPAMRSWRTALSGRLPPQRPLTILELGSGTGRFSGIIADIGGGPVYAVEPSRGMRAVAAGQPADSAVRSIAGRAESIPIATASCDAVVMFFVLQHITDLHSAAHEMARVLRAGGHMLVAGSFSERLHPRAYYNYLPRTREIEAQLFPTLASTEELFRTVGLTAIGLDEVEHEIADSLTTYSVRLAHLAISTFEHLTDDEITQGLAHLNKAAYAETTPQPIRHTHDLLTAALTQKR